MNIQETPYCNVSERVAVLGLELPTKLALLPRHFDDAGSKGELFNESSAVTVRKLWKQAGLELTPLEKPGENLPEIHENDFKLIMPVIFIGYSLWSENPTAVALALNVASNYITDFFKGFSGGKKLELDIVVEKTAKKDYRRLSYKGNPEGLPHLPELVEKMMKDGH